MMIEKALASNPIMLSLHPKLNEDDHNENITLYIYYYKGSFCYFSNLKTIFSTQSCRIMSGLFDGFCTVWDKVTFYLGYSSPWFGIPTMKLFPEKLAGVISTILSNRMFTKNRNQFCDWKAVRRQFSFYWLFKGLSNPTRIATRRLWNWLFISSGSKLNIHNWLSNQNLLHQ